MVSSKCSQVESPSPFVFTAPLMPPCAQTECERFTGTTEKSSTSCPASAIFIAAASPARPPPTIAILIGVAICVRQTSVCRLSTRAKLKLVGLQNSRNQSAGSNESNGGVDAYSEKQQAECDTRITRQTLRAFADCDSPIDHEKPDAIPQMPHDRRNSN